MSKLSTAVFELLKAIHDCEVERQTAQLSGLETGWEHPNTPTMWRRVLFMADRVVQEQSKPAAEVDPNSPTLRDCIERVAQRTWRRGSMFSTVDVWEIEETLRKLYYTRGLNHEA